MNSILQRFAQLIENDKLAHLYLFCGNGKETNENLVFELAYQIIMSKSLKPNLKEQMKLGTYPNFYYVATESNEITKEQVLNLQKEFTKTSLVDGFRVFMIKDAHKLNSASANSLLKFLEEPSGSQTIGLLLTNSLDQIMPTIRSRSQVISLTNDEEFKNNLLDNDFSLLQTTFLPYLTDNLENAKILVSDERFINLCEVGDTFVKKLTQGEISFIENYHKRRILFDNKEYFHVFTNFLLDLFLDVKKAINGLEITNLYYLNQVNQLKLKLDTTTINNIVSIIQQTNVMLRSYVNLKMQYENLLTQIEGVIR